MCISSSRPPLGLAPALTGQENPLGGMGSQRPKPTGGCLTSRESTYHPFSEPVDWGARQVSYVSVVTNSYILFSSSPSIIYLLVLFFFPGCRCVARHRQEMLWAKGHDLMR